MKALLMLLSTWKYLLDADLLCELRVTSIPAASVCRELSSQPVIQVHHRLSQHPDGETEARFSEILLQGVYIYRDRIVGHDVRL